MRDTTVDQDRQFADEAFGNLLEQAVEWIRNNLQPDQVFAAGELEEWAKAWAAGEDPEDVVGDDRLRAWAEANGFEEK